MPKMGSVVIGDFIELVFQGPDSRLAVHEPRGDDFPRSEG